MTDISKIKGLLDWKLLMGSHEWPGPDGGTCINEAAIVVAGFRYHPVGGPDDFPPCFSKELGLLLLSLNDALTDARRQKLMRFVLRLPGSRDKARIERKRCRLLYDAFVLWLAGQSTLGENLLSKLRSKEDRQAFIEGLAEVVGVTIDLCPSPQLGDAMLDEALDIVEQAFAIGRQAQPDDTALVEARLAKVRKLLPA